MRKNSRKFDNSAKTLVMARKTSYHSFTPDPRQAELAPEISGNSINGLAETDFRPASYVYWHEDPDQIPHGQLQRWFYTQNTDDPRIKKAREARARSIKEPVPPVAPERVPGDAAQWSQRLDAYHAELDCELLGVTQMQPEWVYEGRSIVLPNVIMVAVEHDYEEVRHAPELRGGAEVIRQYDRAIKAANQLAGWIRRQGYAADPHGGPNAGPLLMIPPAIACGFGELGRHGSIINRDMGSSFRLSAVTTDMPLVPTPAQSYGVDDFCSRCQVCSNACPVDAIKPEKQMVRGKMKWYVDFDRCLPFFNEHYGCAICITVCPFSLPGRGPRIVEQLRRRLARKGESSEGD